MTEQKALELLDLEPCVSASEIRRAYQEIYNELQIRLTNAPTEHQKELYRKRLSAVEEAYLFLGGESEEDLSELPCMGPIESTSEEKAQSSKPQPISEAAALELLGLSKPFSRWKLVDAYKSKKEDFDKGLNNAPNNAIKDSYQQLLNELEQAFSLLEPLVESPAAVPPKPETPKAQPKPEKKKASPLLWAIPAILLLAAGIWFFLPKGEKQDEISQELKEEFIRIKGQADLLAEQQDWNKALEKYQEAYALMADIQVKDSIASIEQRLDLVESSTQKETEAKDWSAAQKANSTAGYLDFIKKYPSGTYTIQAEQKIKDLESISVAANEVKEVAIQELQRNMVFVQGGTFTMGCTGEQTDYCGGDEEPAHPVTLSSFNMGKYEVTQAQWAAVMGNNPSNFKGCDNCPVENVNWNVIQEFLRKLNQMTGKNYRLPTEAEWEYAARGGNRSQGYLYSGSNNLGNVAWFGDNSGFKTHPVGKKSANELGLYDMSGNVWEWCSDWYDKDYYTNSPSSNPRGPSSGSIRVLRGGSLLNIFAFETDCRVAHRNGNTPDVSSRNVYYGFRVVLSL